MISLEFDEYKQYNRSIAFIFYIRLFFIFCQADHLKLKRINE
jgi:hypothetical protein